MNYEGWRRYLVAGWAWLETLLFGGLIYGWAPVVYMFKRRGIYANLCPPSFNDTSVNANKYTNTTSPSLSVVLLNGTVAPEVDIGTSGFKCGPQDDKFALAFTIGSAMFCVSSAAFGQINYKFGTRVTRIISMIIFVAGTLMFAFVSIDLPWLIFPALTCVGVGGLPLLMTNAQISSLFPTGASTFIGLLCGAYDSSSVVQLIVKLLDENDILSKYSYLVITGLHVIVIVSTFVFLPKGMISRPDQSPDSDIAKDEKAVELLEKHVNNDSVYEKTTLEESHQNASVPSLKECILSSEYLIHVGWLCLIQLRFYYFLGTANTYITRLTNNNPDHISYFTNVMVYTMLGGLISTSVSGVVYDVSTRMYVDSRSALKRRLMPSVLPLVVATSFAALFSILVLIPNVQVLYGVFIFMTLTRSFLYGVGTAYLSATFPGEYFGVLYGIMILCGGVVSFVQFAMFKWSQVSDTSHMQADIFCLCLCLIAMAHPVAQWWKCKREEYKLVKS